LERSCHIVWSDLKGRLRKRLGSKRFNLWLSTSRLVKVEGDRVVIGLPSGLHVDMARRHFTEEVAHVLKSVLGWQPDVHFVVDRELFHRQREQEATFKRQTAIDWPTDYSLPLDEAFSLEHYAVGPTNRTASEQLKTILTRSTPRIAFLTGPRATGKTHLAVGLALWFRKNLSAKVTYTTPSAFQNALHEAIRRHEQPLFRKTMRECDLFVLDETETLPKHARIHEEMLHTLEHLDLREAHVLLVGRTPPGRLAIPPRLRSRLQRGPLLQVDHPDRALRREIVRSIFARYGEVSALIADDVAETLAMRFRSVEALVEAARHVVATAIMRRTCGGETITSSTLASLPISSEKEPGILAASIAEAVGEHLHVAMEEILSGSRKRAASRARRLCVLAIRQLMPDLTLTQIGSLFSVSHAAVHQMLKEAKRLLENNPSLQRFYEDLLRRFSG